MAICSGCGSESPRVLNRWNDKGQLPDKCPNCSPSSFEKFTAPSDKKIWMGYEAHPNEYVKSADGGYDRKPEYRAEQEQRLSAETDEERENRLRAEASKRATRRTRTMDPEEHFAAIAKATQIVNAMKDRDLFN